MKTKLISGTILFLLLSLSAGSIIFAQNINGKLGTGGQFIIRDTTNTYLTLSQSNGDLSLNRGLVLLASTQASQFGTIFKGTSRFIHNFFPASSSGSNTFLGINSGNFTMNGTGSLSSNNTGVGHNSLTGLTTGYQNSAFGVNSLTGTTTGYRNSAFGFNSMIINTTGSNNSAYGFLTLNANTTGNYNSAFGLQSLMLNTEGNWNSAFGCYSLNSNITGIRNSAFGFETLFSNSTGSWNSAFGLQSPQFNTSGNQNSAFGYFSGNGITTGSNNTTLGFNAQVPSPASDNQVRIGNTNVTYAGIQVPWTITSDKRWKNNILSSGLGLNFISKLNPVSYYRTNDKTQRTEYGFIAQEVEEILKESGVENSGMLTITNEGMYELRYNDLLAPMVKAIQELKAENDELKNNNEILTAKVESLSLLELKLAKLEQLVKELSSVKNVTLSDSK